MVIAKYNCDYCGKEINVTPSVLKTRQNGERKSLCCSIECRNKLKRQAEYVNIVCKQCGKTFVVIANKSKGREFCSLECRKTYTYIPYHCDLCGKEFLVNRYRIENVKNGKQKGLYCSQECHYKQKTVSKLIKTTCKYCNKEFDILPSILKRKKNVFCSDECSFKYKEEGLHLTWYDCDYCGKRFRVLPYKVKQKQIGKKKGLYCSKECANNAKLNGEKIKCNNCGKELYRTEYRQNKNEHSFCSNKCQKEWNAKNIPSTKVGKICTICGTYYEIIPSQAEKSVACSRKCLATYSALLQQGRKSSIEVKIENKLNELKINFQDQCLIENKFIVDFYLPDQNIIIEAFGDYWHSNPLVYGDKKKPLNDCQIKQKKKDKSRLAYLNKCGFKIFVLWEMDINNDIDKAISEVINYINKVQQNPVTTTA